MSSVYPSEVIVQKLSRAVRDAGVFLPEDVKHALRKAYEQQLQDAPDSLGASVFEHILQNIKDAETHRLPICQDTGMAVVFAEQGIEGYVSRDIESVIHKALAQAVKEGNFRPSVVEDPVFTRKNTMTGLPAVIHYSRIPGDVLRISGLLKGFGSENCSAVSMLNPTAGEQGVIGAVLEAVKKAGGKPCPPVIIGVGIGGTADSAPILAKRALLRETGSAHPDQRYAELERTILDQVNRLGIGPGGLGGDTTALAVMIEHAHTHIAGLPVAVNISCWADRKFCVEIAVNE